MPELFSYKMTSDTGFAPNPFFGILSLATCKPGIRESRKPGDYIAGFSSKLLCNDGIGEERLVFIMKVTDKITYDTYFNNKEFQIKKPSRQSKMTLCGDNIYNKLDFKYYQAQSYFHKKIENIKHDLSSDKVLLSSDFFYFGSKAISINRFKINIPRGQSRYGSKTSNSFEIERLWNYLIENYKINSVLGIPHAWSKDERFHIKNGCS